MAATRSAAATRTPGYTDPQMRGALLVAECPAHRRRTDSLPAGAFVDVAGVDVQHVHVERRAGIFGFAFGIGDGAAQNFFDVLRGTLERELQSVQRVLRMSPAEARSVMDLIRGQKAQDALHTLQFTLKRSAKHIEKVLRSAIANAERKAEDAGAPLDVDMLYVNTCYVNEGTALEAIPSCADGPGIPLPEAHRAFVGRCGRASCRRRGTRRSHSCRNGSAKGGTWYGAPGSQSFDR